MEEELLERLNNNYGYLLSDTTFGVLPEERQEELIDILDEINMSPEWVLAALHKKTPEKWKDYTFDLIKSPAFMVEVDKILEKGKGDSKKKKKATVQEDKKEQEAAAYFRKVESYLTKDRYEVIKTLHGRYFYTEHGDGKYVRMPFLKHTKNAEFNANVNILLAQDKPFEDLTAEDKELLYTFGHSGDVAMYKYEDKRLNWSQIPPEDRKLEMIIDGETMEPATSLLPSEGTCGYAPVQDNSAIKKEIKDKIESNMKLGMTRKQATALMVENGYLANANFIYILKAIGDKDFRIMGQVNIKDALKHFSEIAFYHDFKITFIPKLIQKYVIDKEEEPTYLKGHFEMEGLDEEWS